MQIAHRSSGLATATLVVAALLLISPSAVNGADNWSVVGTWVVWSEIQPGSRVPSLHTYHQDGTITSSDVFSFGGLPGVPIRNTPLYGVWEKTKPNAYACTYLSLVYDAASSLFIGFLRARAELSFTGNDTNEIPAAIHIDFLSCQTPVSCPDPKAPDAAWMPLPGFPSTFKATATRLSLVPTD